MTLTDVHKLQEWDLNNDISALSFDTTASNTGKNGACVPINKYHCSHYFLEETLKQLISCIANILQSRNTIF